jgi:hypothetical protein
LFVLALLFSCNNFIIALGIHLFPFLISPWLSITFLLLYLFCFLQCSATFSEHFIKFFYFSSYFIYFCKWVFL